MIRGKNDFFGRFEGIGPITGTGGEIWNGTCRKPVANKNSKIALFRASAIGGFGGVGTGKQLCSSRMFEQTWHSAWCKRPKYGCHLNSHYKNLEIVPVPQ